MCYDLHSKSRLNVELTLHNNALSGVCREIERHGVVDFRLGDVRVFAISQGRDVIPPRPWTLLYPFDAILPIEQGVVTARSLRFVGRRVFFSGRFFRGVRVAFAGRIGARFGFLGVFIRFGYSQKRMTRFRFVDENCFAEESCSTAERNGIASSGMPFEAELIMCVARFLRFAFIAQEGRERQIEAYFNVGRHPAEGRRALGEHDLIAEVAICPLEEGFWILANAGEIEDVSVIRRNE